MKKIIINLEIILNLGKYKTLANIASVRRLIINSV